MIIVEGVNDSLCAVLISMSMLCISISLLLVMHATYYYEFIPDVQAQHANSVLTFATNVLDKSFAKLLYLIIKRIFIPFQKC